MVDDFDDYSLFVGSSGRGLKIKHKVDSPVYNHTLTTILVEYASAVYISDLTDLFTWTCSRCDGLTKGFEVIELLLMFRTACRHLLGLQMISMLLLLHSEALKKPVYRTGLQTYSGSSLTLITLVAQTARCIMDFLMLTII